MLLILLRNNLVKGFVMKKILFLFLVLVQSICCVDEATLNACYITGACASLYLLKKFIDLNKQNKALDVSIEKIEGSKKSVQLTESISLERWKRIKKEVQGLKEIKNRLKNSQTEADKSQILNSIGNLQASILISNGYFHEFEV